MPSGARLNIIGFLDGVDDHAFPSENVEIAEKVAELVDGVAATSGDQARGIEQISKGMAEMDRVAQQNAASSEESASASEEMKAQAKYLSEFVQKLITLVGKKSIRS